MLRPWDVKIHIRRNSRTAVFLQIAHALIEEIRRGRLAPGSALPGTRELAESLRVNRKTVVQAYDELTAQGWLAAERTRGTFIATIVDRHIGARFRQTKRNRASNAAAAAGDERYPPFE